MENEEGLKELVQQKHTQIAEQASVNSKTPCAATLGCDGIVSEMLSRIDSEIDVMTAEIEERLNGFNNRGDQSNPVLMAILRDEVVPACGCTEPSAVAFATAVAFRAIKEEIPHTKASDVFRIRVILSPAVLKNGAGVAIPNTDGMRGIKIAAALGALCGDPDLKLEVLRNIDKSGLDMARRLVSQGNVEVACDEHAKGLKIQALLWSKDGSASALVEGGHTDLKEVVVNEKVVRTAGALGDGGLSAAEAKSTEHKKTLRSMSIEGLVRSVQQISSADLRYLANGIVMNLHLARAGLHDAYAAAMIKISPWFFNDYAAEAAFFVTVASNARMSGCSEPAMSSGGSGNQGIMAILIPWIHGERRRIPFERILQSIALSHLMNSYAKCFLGDLSPICGCAVAAGLGASGAIAYQRSNDMESAVSAISMAVNNLVADIAGLLCDGAKKGCAMKVYTSATSACRAAELALSGYGVEEVDGIIGRTAEESIRNLGRIGMEGMEYADGTVIDIIRCKGV